MCAAAVAAHAATVKFFGMPTATWTRQHAAAAASDLMSSVVQGLRMRISVDCVPTGVVGCGLCVAGCGLWVVGCGLWVVGCGLWVVGCGLGLWVVGCGFVV